MSLETIKHRLKWNTWAGAAARNIAIFIGLKLLRAGRKILKWSKGRCSWCGANCGFDSTVSKKGLRCESPNRKCTDKPDA